jgi:hypothetical protein
MYIKIVISVKNPLNLLVTNVTTTRIKKFILIVLLQMFSSGCSKVFDYFTKG